MGMNKESSWLGKACEESPFQGSLCLNSAIDFALASCGSEGLNGLHDLSILSIGRNVVYS